MRDNPVLDPDGASKGIAVPLLDLFWTMLILFLWIAWLSAVVSVLVDIFRNDQSSGFQKALWVLFVIIIPWLGVLAYLIAQGDDMAKRTATTAIRREQEARTYVRTAAGTTSTADELEKLADLRASGVITDAEFEAQKSRVLA